MANENFCSTLCMFFYPSPQNKNFNKVMKNLVSMIPDFCRKGKAMA